MDKKQNQTIKDFCKEDYILMYLTCTLGILITTIGTLCATYNIPQWFVNSKFESSLKIATDSPIYAAWIDPPVPIYMKFYVFDVLNGDKIVKGEKPHLREKGPYVYRMQVPKFNVSFHSNGSVSFFNNHTLYFERGMSSGSENDVVNTLNVPLASMGSMVTDLPPFVSYFGMMQRMVTMAGGSKLFSPRTIKEIIWGYQDPIFTMLNNLQLFTGEKVEPIFGFFHKFNNSDDGSYLVHTGVKNYKQVHQIIKWKGEKYLKFWSTKYANMINGTDGSFLGPDITTKDTPYMYFPQMCRSMKLEYEQESEIKGIKTMQFHLSDDFLANSTINPNNADFCVPPGNCYDSGVLNVQSSMGGAPGFVSLPHFYNAAEKYQKAFDGLNPQKDEHDSIFHVEPKSGAVLKGDRKLQINILLKSSQYFEQLKRVRELIFPVVWLGGAAEVDDATASELRSVMSIVKFMGVVSYLIIASGISILLGFFLCLASMWHRGKLTCLKSFKNRKIKQNNVEINRNEIAL
ncbi:lysosome membrane protein 2-like [Styela clava]